LKKSNFLLSTGFYGKAALKKKTRKIIQSLTHYVDVPEHLEYSFYMILAEW
jgi:hypothetical protein